MSAQVLFPSDPATLWSVTDDPQWICSLLPGCVEVVKTSGSGEAYTATVNLSGSGVSLPSGLSQLKVAISVSDRIPGQSLNVKMTTSNALGRFTTTAAIALQDRGDNSSVTYKTTSASGTGVVGQLAVRNLSGSIKTQLGSSSENFATRMERQQSVALAVKPLAVLPNGRTQVRTTILVDFPDFLEAPSVNGRVRIWSKNRIICSKAIVDSQATCSLSVSRKKIANLLVTTSGTLSTGTDFSLGSTLRLRPTRNGR